MEKEGVITQGSSKKKLNVPLLIFMVSILFTVLLWDRYFNSVHEVDRMLVSHLILFCGFMFSLGASLFVSSLEGKRVSLEREVKTLRGFIPICAYCKNVRDDAGFWSGVEAYLGQNTYAKFSHGICPDCLKKETEKMQG